MGVRGNTASGSVNRPRCSRRLIQVLLFIKEGEKVKVHTRRGHLPGEPRR